MDGPRTLDDLYAIVCMVSNWFFAFVLVVAIAAFLYAALLFFMSQGGEKVATAKKYLLYATVGTAIAILAKSLVIVIGNLIGVNVGGFLCG